MASGNHFPAAGPAATVSGTWVKPCFCFTLPNFFVVSVKNRRSATACPERNSPVATGCAASIICPFARRAASGNSFSVSRREKTFGLSRADFTPTPVNTLDF